VAFVERLALEAVLRGWEIAPPTYAVTTHSVYVQLRDPRTGAVVNVRGSDHPRPGLARLRSRGDCWEQPLHRLTPAFRRRLARNPARSEAQRRLFGAALACQRGRRCRSARIARLARLPTATLRAFARRRRP
jgi:hypothetical protein